MTSMKYGVSSLQDAFSLQQHLEAQPSSSTERPLRGFHQL